MRKIYFLAFSILASASLMATQVKVAVGTNLQAAVDGASSGDTVLVEEGIYEGNFTMKDGVYVSGGWNADFTAQTEHASILDAKANGRVLNQPKDFTTLTIWDNFTIQNGKLTVALADQLGAGVALLKNGRVINCLVQNNTFTYDPATQCAGGGIAQNSNGDTCAINCIVLNNKATHGGGIRIRGVVLNSTVESNVATKNGGGIYLQGSAAAYNCVILKNTCAEGGGGIDTYGSVRMVGCLVAENTAGNVGGIQMRSANRETSDSGSDIINCTVVNNKQTKTNNPQFCGVRLDVRNNPSRAFINNVVWGNTVNGEAQTQEIGGYPQGYGTFLNNAFAGTTASVTYIQLKAENDPQFDANYECAATSPLYNAGSNEALTYLVGDKDVYGNARKQNGAIEIGAVESITKYYVAEGTDLQAAVDGASSGDTVLVQAGTYEGNFTMRDGVYVSGGWNADFTAQTEHASTLDANNSGRVLNQPANFNTLTIWDNFTIQNGKLTAIQSDKLGSGVALMKKGRVINCLIQNNTFDYSGNCMGGGLGQETGDKNDTCAINCVVRNNKGTHGGGVRIRGVILNSLVEKNTSTNNGGGIYLQAGAAYNCVIVNNTSNSGGGGVDMFNSGYLVNCLVANNTAAAVGGVSMRSSSRDTDDSGSNIINCTVVNNTQTGTKDPQFCGVRLDVCNNPSRAFINNVVWGNTVNGEVQPQELGGYPQGYGKFLNNAIAGTTASVTYIQLNAENDPQFDANYECAATSPLYNAGSNAALTYLVGDKDVYGNARVQNGAIEIGAVESITKYYVAVGTELQAAVDGASSGDTVLVQAGTYEGNFTMVDGVFVSGGWNADFTAQTEHASILDAKQNGRVLNQPAEFTALTIWDNFTIQNGKLTEVLSDKLGAGVALLKNGRVINCLVQNNTFTYDPATQCAGGGIAQNCNGDTCAINCIVRNNKATHGGGIRTAGVAINCLVENNEATGNGGGVYLHNIGQLHNSIVRNNVCKKDVGGIDIAAAGGAVYNCLVVGNHADGNIGGVQARKYNDVINTTIVGNNHNTTAADRVTWAGFRASDNTATNYNGKLFVNNVIWGNTHNDTLVNQVMPYLKHYATNGKFVNNALQGTSVALDTIGTVTYIHLSAENDPQFNEDYSFATTSPLYNAGTNDALTYLVGDKDVYGNARVQNGAIEIGAVECAMALLADGDNSVVIEANKDMKTNVLLKRTFKANDGYYTICLPFDIAASEIGQAFQVKSILDAGAEGFNVEFKEVEELVAGQPYLVLPSKNLTNPTFEDVMIKNVSATANEVTGAGIKVAFTGVINGGGETNGTTEYWVGNGGYLYNNKTAKLGLRAFFTITDAEGNPTKVRARVVTSENETAGFENITIGAEVVKTIENGQLIIICSGEKYNAQGVRL